MPNSHFRELRRTDRGISPEEAAGILEIGKIGYLGVLGDDGYPYVIPLNYAHDAERQCLYFHSALEGHKLDAIKAYDKVCFSVTTKAEVLVDAISMKFDSVIVFGKAHLIEGEEKEHGIRMLLDKYILGKGTITATEVADYVQKHIQGTAVIKIDIEHLSGKNRLE